jgi:hypothetical protein
VGYWGVDCYTKHVVFMKDVWRTNEGVESEGVILKRLREEGVSHIPTVVCHRDVAVKGMRMLPLHTARLKLLSPQKRGRPHGQMNWQEDRGQKVSTRRKLG